MAALGIDLKELQDTVWDITIVRYTAVATLALLVTDYFYTFEEERRYVWPSKLTIPKIIFFINRYVPFIGTGGVIHVLIVTPPHHTDECLRTFHGFGGLVTCSYLIAELILFMRAYAVWQCGKKTLIFCCLVLVCMYTVGVYFSGVFLHNVNVVDIELFHKGCIVEFRKQVDWIAFIVLISAETIALTLLLVKARQLTNSPIMKIMFRDGLIYYVFILATSVANVIVLKSASPTLCNFLLATQGALHSIFCTRLLLNIRGVYESIDMSIANLSSRSTTTGQLPGPGVGRIAIVKRGTSRDDSLDDMSEEEY